MKIGFVVNEVATELVKDGMFLVGLDVVEDKLMEINVFSPGGLVGAGRLASFNFADMVIDALEQKVSHRDHDPHRYSNSELATM